MQRSDFTFKGVCSYILYRAMEEERTVGSGIYESNQMETDDCVRISDIFKKNVQEDRIIILGDTISFDIYTKFKKVND